MAKTYAQKAQEDWERGNSGRNVVAVQMSDRNNARNERRMHRMINSSVYGKNEQKSSGGNNVSEKNRKKSDTRETIEKAFRNSGRTKLKK